MSIVKYFVIVFQFVFLNILYFLNIKKTLKTACGTFKIELKKKNNIKLTENEFSSTLKTCLELISKSQMEK